ncbi:Glutathione S-transferase [Sphingomonas antarctica]|uniref:glutathione S-transferase family protein n=1 Tax=Sphingomonas antarctica TaxID=2040274 RepID=UPI0039EB75F1
MPVDPSSPLVITSLAWVPEFARGHVRDYRARWACEELGLDYAERLVGTPRPDSYYHDQPWGQVPALHDGDIELFESGAIMLHLAEKGETLLPAGAQARARAISWLFAAMNTIEPLMFELTNVNVFARGEEWAKLRKPSLYEFLGQRLDRLADSLGDKDWLEGDFTIGDLAMTSVLRVGEGSASMKQRPTLTAYLERAKARPAFRRAIADQLKSFEGHEPAPVAKDGEQQ